MIEALILGENLLSLLNAQEIQKSGISRDSLNSEPARAERRGRGGEGAYLAHDGEDVWFPSVISVSAYTDVNFLLERIRLERSCQREDGIARGQLDIVEDVDCEKRAGNEIDVSDRKLVINPATRRKRTRGGYGGHLRVDCGEAGSRSHCGTFKRIEPEKSGDENGFHCSLAVSLDASSWATVAIQQASG